MLCSIIFRSPATAALAVLGAWLLLAVLWPLLAPAIAQIIAPPDPASILLGRPSLETLQWQQVLERLSPTHLFGEGVIAILSPSTRALGPIFLEQLQGAVIGSPLPFAQSLLLAWPQLVGLLAATILLFALGYVTFQRQEVRA
jgi:ABC-2 type transport system permease protein